MKKVWIWKLSNLPDGKQILNSWNLNLLTDGKRLEFELGSALIDFIFSRWGTETEG